MQEEYVTVDSLRIRYLVSGHGSPILLVHGVGEFLEVWKTNIADLSRQFTVYALDLPGHGLSQKPKTDFTLGYSVKFIARFLETMNIEKANLIGHSLGGVVCMGFAMNYPGKADKLMLVASGGFTNEVPLSYRLVRLPILGNILLGPTFLINKATIRVGLKRQFYNIDTAPEDWVSIVSKHLKMPDRKNTIRNIARSNTGNNYIKSRLTNNNMLPMVELPTLIVHGRQDRLVPVENARNASNLIPHAGLEILDECGHHPQIEKTPEFNNLVLQFFKPD